MGNIICVKFAQIMLPILKSPTNLPLPYIISILIGHIRYIFNPAVGRHSEMDKLTFLMEKYAKY